ncbi:uncharacterized protein AMSG_00573 [Thecamonas trahens ATCC 50062]|uniref:Uncharacterized protein n=1 Tax=Thecamonas trahens ATCC 50062 TaxID=461836 RepID=A0A0L0DBV9_THETB|nr:hypothetical protein AMSG_00573 [Thecamonas trahens ATCC 50062]KNC48793.1 hypothetical protein AMSG_00573 [Thecamonas trahens ATCC 50062]|eukprot:XP_013762844.1 hypothetical protein AMSG_00573 [Thecamonas trahens ATCC 50062]
MSEAQSQTVEHEGVQVTAVSQGLMKAQGPDGEFKVSGYHEFKVIMIAIALHRRQTYDAWHGVQQGPDGEFKVSGYHEFKVTGVNTTTTTKTLNAALVLTSEAAAAAEAEASNEAGASEGGDGGDGKSEEAEASGKGKGKSGSAGKSEPGEVGRAAVYMEIESGREVVLTIVVETKNQEPFDAFQIAVEAVYEF